MLVPYLSHLSSMRRYYPDAAEASMPPDARLARQIHETESAKLRKEGKLRGEWWRPDDFMLLRWLVSDIEALK